MLTASATSNAAAPTTKIAATALAIRNRGLRPPSDGISATPV
jgi:hypothetical protein